MPPLDESATYRLMPQSDWLPPHVTIGPWHGSALLQSIEGRHALVTDHHIRGDYEQVVERDAGRYRGAHRRKRRHR